MITIYLIRTALYWWIWCSIEGKPEREIDIAPYAMLAVPLAGEIWIILCIAGRIVSSNKNK